ncbi:MAG: sulfatase-like hydrolase/transferase [Epibacterium sp.]|nr:sulfatase-like hydrolase/transferase [Epibacterium sp.]
MIGDDGVDGYFGTLSQDSATIAEVLKGNGNKTLMSGKWHVCNDLEGPSDGPADGWPCGRGFDEYFGMLTGAGSYFAPKHMLRNNEKITAPDGDWYFTDAISDEAVDQIRRHHSDNPEQPFFQYVAYTAPHWPLHAKPEDIAKYDGKYAEGWD